ncbi:MAG: O-antigen ligase family protein [Bacteroidota bacterium]
MERIFRLISLHQWKILLLASIALVTCGSVFMAWYMKVRIFYAVPVLMVGALQVIYNYKPLFYLCLASIPISLQVEMGGGFTLDVASEPLMLVLLGVFTINLVAGKQFRLRKKVSGFHIFIFLLIFWTFFTMITSEFVFRSFKFLLAKVWYLTTFVYIAGDVIKSPKQVRNVFWAFFIPMALATTAITIEHALLGFAFEFAHGVAYPLFQNGVIYATCLVLFIPWCWYARSWYTPKSLEWYIINIGMGIMIVATIFTFKRAAWAALIILPIIDQAIKRKIFDKLLYAFVIIATITLAWLVHDNTFYQFAPNYQKVIWHEGDISGHLEATLSGTEISGMERFYRWVAAKNMIADMPFFGSGPSTFNQVYKRYTDDAFRTYVSDNPEQSTTHNYFLLTFSEQGFPGGLLFIAMVLYMLLSAAWLYPKVKDDNDLRSILMLSLLSFSTILFHSLLNEIIEVDKIGPMFFLNMLLIHKVGLWHENRIIHEG